MSMRCYSFEPGRTAGRRTQPAGAVSNPVPVVLSRMMHQQQRAPPPFGAQPDADYKTRHKHLDLTAVAC
jgi:hypothetical protein